MSLQNRVAAVHCWRCDLFRHTSVLRPWGPAVSRLFDHEPPLLRLPTRPCRTVFLRAAVFLLAAGGADAPQTDPAAFLLADGEHRRHRPHARRARVCSRSICRRPRFASGPARWTTASRRCCSARFPKLKIAKGGEALKAAFAGATFCCTARALRWWRRRTWCVGGEHGQALRRLSASRCRRRTRPREPPPRRMRRLAKTIEVLSGARFVFFRDSMSLHFAKAEGLHLPDDGVRARRCVRRGPARRRQSRRLSQSNSGLEEGKFLCCIPRLRYTPYWTIPRRMRAFRRGRSTPATRR